MGGGQGLQMCVYFQKVLRERVSKKLMQVIKKKQMDFKISTPKINFSFNTIFHGLFDAPFYVFRAIFWALEQLPPPSLPLRGAGSAPAQSPHIQSTFSVAGTLVPNMRPGGMIRCFLLDLETPCRCLNPSAVLSCYLQELAETGPDPRNIRALKSDLSALCLSQRGPC